MEEIYKDIPGYEGSYQVSNYGNVKSIKFGKERLLKANKTSRGYLSISLCINNKAISKHVHQLVAITFLSHTPNGYELVVNHIDNNKLNNNINNLELVSTRYNTSCHKTDAGVNWHKKQKRWNASISINNKRIHLGSYENKQDALDAYQNKLKEL